MKRNILLPLLFIFMSIFGYGQITLTTTSSSGSWSPAVVVNTGNVLTWTAADNTAVGGTFTGQVISADDPAFDFSGNNGTPITITVTNSDGFVGLTHLWVNGLNIVNIDVDNATELIELNIKENRNIGTVNLSTLLKLEKIHAQTIDLATIDFSQNDVLKIIEINDNNLSTIELDKVIFDLDVNGQTGGNLKIARNTGQLSFHSYSAYNSLIGKGWTIDVPAPPSGPNTEVITLTTTSNLAGWSIGRLRNTGLIPHWKAEGAGITTQEFDEYKPVFDFSSNNGNNEITITITSDDGFDYFDETSLYIDISVNNGLSDIIRVDISNANNLKYLYPNQSNLDSINVSSLVELQRLLIHGNNKQLGGQPSYLLDISSNLNLYQLFVENTYIQTLSSLQSNDLLRDIDLRDSEFTSAALDQILIDLDQNGITNPPPPQVGTDHIKLSGNPGHLTSASLAAYNNLIAKGWTIDVGPPSAIAGVEIDVTGINNSIPGDGSNTPGASDDTDFGTVAENGTITKTFTIHSYGDTELNLTGNPLVAISGLDAADFATTVPTTPVAANGGDTTFDVTFSAPVGGGIKNAVLTIENDDPDESNYTFNIQATSLVTGPEIDISFNGNSIVSNSVAIVTNGNDFGQVAIGSFQTRTFTITNIGDQDLTLVLPGSGPYDSSFLITKQPTTPIVSGSSITFDITFTPSALGSISTVYLLYNNDSDENPFVLQLKGEGVAGSSGTIDVQGNGISIVNGDTTPDIADDTDFGQVINNNIKPISYVITNNGTTDLTINNISLPYSDTEFSITNNPSPLTITPGNSTTFDVSFSPLATGNYTANVQIDNSETANDPFTYKIAGEGVDVLITNDIMITQYYSGFSATDKWIEIKNISGAPIPIGTYFLALYNETAIPNIDSQAPTANIQIPAMTTDEVLLFNNGASAKPLSGNLGGATQISTAVCNFDGDDVILISTTNDATCYSHREDIIGDILVNPTNPWGADRTFIKGGCATEEAHADFDINDWIRIPISEIDAADASTNLALGTQAFGPTEFNGSVWSNLTPDRSRTVIITTSFNNANQTFTACNLVVNNGVIANFNSNGATNNSIVLYGDLTTIGTLTIGNTESLVTLGDTPTLGTITKIEKSNTLDNIHDNTYWASPVLGSSIGTIFTGVDATRIFEYKAGDPNPIYPPTAEYRFWYNKPSGGMIIGKGYAVEGPDNPVDANGDYITPFRHELTFVGTPFSGTLTLDLYYSGSPDQDQENNNFNLIGNPYPTAIDIDKFFSDNQNVRDIALWTHATIISGGEFTKDDYVTYNRDGSTIPSGSVSNNIGSGQGFMARTTSETDIRFLDSHKMIGANNQFFKSSNTKKDLANKEFEGDKIWLEMRDDTGYKSNIMVGFSARATDGLDSKYDSYGYVSERDIKLYSIIEQVNSEFVIQNLNSFSTDKKVSIGIDNKNIGNFKISIVGKLGALKDAEVYLVDNLLNVTHNLKAGDYEFEQTATGSFPNRFTLQFAGQALDVDDEILAENGFVVTNDLESLRIQSSKEVLDIKVYDLLGRMVIHKQPNAKTFNLSTSAIKNGTVLVLNATLENGTVISKKTIKY